MLVSRALKRSLSSIPNTEPIDKMRNLIIIAHIDSGKSTLSDRFLQVTGAVSADRLRERSQYLDSNPIERDRQITIKARAARMQWRQHAITLIDCPGHHDFSRQVSQSARAVEAALLLVDATRGVQAQTLSSVEIALEAGLELLPVINKVDLPTADVARARDQIERLVGLDAKDSILTSAKSGMGVEDCLDAVIECLPAPVGSRSARLQALVFDSYYDVYRGVVLFVRVVNGVLRKGDSIVPMAGSGANGGKGLSDRQYHFSVDGLGVLTPEECPCEVIGPGEIGFVTAAIRKTGDVPVGDTLTHVGKVAAVEPLPGYEESKPLVFCGLFPTERGDFNGLRLALEKLQLQDGSVWFEPDKSGAMGSGFRCGFLGLLHMSVTQERLEKEFGLDLIASTPSVSYKILPEGEKEWRWITNASDIPDGRVKFEEVMARVDVICHNEHVGAMIELAMKRRGILQDQKALGMDRAKVVFELPLAELVTDLHDAIKSKSCGFASMSYDISGMRQSALTRMDIRVATEVVEGLSCVVHTDNIAAEGRWIVERLKQVIPRQMFKVSIQAVVGGKVIASEHISAFRKDVTAKCYGGDASRKKKLLKRQAEGKKRMKLVGRVAIPQEAFLAVVQKSSA